MAPAATPAAASARKTFTINPILESAVIFLMYALAATVAYQIRTHAIITYGRVIHEFDPWFNFRATQYLADNGIAKFFKWFDHESWFPLGRPVGTTIYPGLQFTSVAIWKVLRWPGWRKTFGLKVRMSLNDVCVFVPCWFGAAASVITGLLTREVSGNRRAGAVAALIMSVIPAHLMRSIGGGYDNESVAMTTMTLTFYLWVRSLRSPSSWPIGILAGLAYGYMVAAWGGFIFVCNMVAVHGAAMVVLGYFTPSLHLAYSLWYVIGTFLATLVPVVGMSPFKSAEQLSALGVFFVLQAMAVVHYLGASRGYNWKDHPAQMAKIRMQVLVACGGAGVVVAGVLAQRGFFGPLSIRVRSLFIKHTKTGNPLVDSVAEHQPANAQAYLHYLRDMLYLVPVGLAFLVAKGSTDSKTDKAFGVPATKWFVVLQTIVTFYFANKMMRLIIFLAPVASVLGGIAIESGVTWSVYQVLTAILEALLGPSEDSPYARLSALVFGAPKPEVAEGADAAGAADASSASPAPSTPSKGGDAAASRATPAASTKKAAAAAASAAAKANSSIHAFLSIYGLDALYPVFQRFEDVYFSRAGLAVRVAVSAAIAAVLFVRGPNFYQFADSYASQISNPSIMFKARLNNGETVMINDYQEAYWWVRDNTPKDSRILAWWDYGYQINGIANRTSLADGNTWNLEHIALVGRSLALPEKRAHKLVKHLADYVLVWAGNQGDDLAKSPHIARISNSVYGDVCGSNDPLCKTFGFYQDAQQQLQPTPSMAASLLYKLHGAGVKQGVSADNALWENVYNSKYGLVRVWKVKQVDMESRAWAMNSSNFKCDAPGSWYCPGQYPPALPDKPPSTHKNIKYDE